MKQIRNRAFIFPLVVTIKFAMIGIGLHYYTKQLDSCGPRPVGKMVKVLKTTKPLYSTTPFQRSDVTVEQIPAKYRPIGAISPERIGEFVGKSVVHRVDDGSALLVTDFEPVRPPSIHFSDKI